jgi:hypothetical protein
LVNDNSSIFMYVHTFLAPERRGIGKNRQIGKSGLTKTLWGFIILNSKNARNGKVSVVSAPQRGCVRCKAPAQAAAESPPGAADPTAQAQ